MIEGLHFDIKTNELEAHLRERERHHFKRGVYYKELADKMKPQDPEIKQLTSVSPIENMRGREERHFAKAQTFEFLADHLAPNEIYRLSRNDLEMTELISGRY